MRIKMVSKLRRHDAAIMELGLEYTDKMAIPPGVLAFPLSGYCIAECTQTVINDFYHCYSHIHTLSLCVYGCLICTLFTFKCVRMAKCFYLITFMFALCIYITYCNVHNVHLCTHSGATKIGYNSIWVTIAYSFTWCSHFNTAFT